MVLEATQDTQLKICTLLTRTLERRRICKLLLLRYITRAWYDFKLRELVKKT